MAVLIPSIKGKMGSTEYFLSKMSAPDLVKTVRSVSEWDEWGDKGLEERFQRDANILRVKNEIAPYLAETKDRFFGSLIVLVYEGDISFQEIKSKTNMDSIYTSALKDMGILMIDKAHLIVLDGQHRLLAIDKVLKHEIKGPFTNEIVNDEISVIFIKHETTQKTRQIFYKVNKTARSTSRGDNIITSEDDGYAIVARMLLRDTEPFKVRVVGDETIPSVNWKNTTLSSRSLQFTTISALYETVKLILKDDNEFKKANLRPDNGEIEEAYCKVKDCWEDIIEGFPVIKESLENIENMPKYRKGESSLLFKPAAQIALVKGLKYATERELKGTSGEKSKPEKMSWEEAVKRANKINWDISAELWKDIIVRKNGNIDPKAEAQESAAELIAYMIVGNDYDENEKRDLQKKYNIAKVGKEEAASLPLLLPSPVSID